MLSGSVEPPPATSWTAVILASKQFPKTFHYVRGVHRGKKRRDGCGEKGERLESS